MFADRAAHATADEALDIELEARFDEREVAGPQAHRDFALEDGRKQGLHEVEQVSDADVAIDHHAFELVEGVFVRGVHLLVAEDAAWGDHAQRRTQLAHAAHLHGRGVGAQQPVAFQPKRILHVARRMVGGDIQGIEIVLVRFDFRAIENAEAEREKEVFDFGLDLRQRVQRAWAGRRRGHGNVDPFVLQAGGEGGGGEGRHLFIQRGFERLLGGIEQLADGGFLVRRHLAHVLGDRGQRAFATEHFDADRFQLFGRRGGGNAPRRGVEQRLQVIFYHPVWTGTGYWAASFSNNGITCA